MATTKHTSTNVLTGELTEYTREEPVIVKTEDSVRLDRAIKYPSLGEFADAMYWNSKGDDSKLTAYYAACEKVKTDNPKPE